MSANISDSMVIRQGPALRVILEVTNGPLSGRKAWLRAGQILRIGRTERADFTVPHDKNMSGLHFTLECGQDVCKVRDDQSANGTTVNGEKVTESPLKHGDEILAGSTKFKINIEGSRDVPSEVAGRTIQLSSAAALELPKHFGPSASKQPVTFRERMCHTGLMALEGNAPEPTPTQVAQALMKLGALYLLVDFNRMALGPPAELKPEYVYDWLPPPVAADLSPVLLSASDDLDPFPILASSWGLGGVVTLITTWERPKLLEHLRGVIRGKTRADGPTPRGAMVGICWPDVLGSMLRDSPAGSRDYLFSAFEAVLLEGAEPASWQIFCRQPTVLKLQRLGFVKAPESAPTVAMTAPLPPAPPAS